MAFILTKEELYTHIYQENIDTITRDQDSIVEKAIQAGIAEAQAYLARFNIALLLPTVSPADWPTWSAPAGFFNDLNLLNKVKDLAAWHLIKLANPNIHLDLFRQSYEDAIEWFKQVQKGQASPYGWPARVDDPDTPYIEGGPIQWASNPKRSNYY